MQELLSGKRIRLLLIESDEALTAQIYAYLEPLGYELDSATSALLGWQRAVSGIYDALLIDVALPGMDGLELCRRLRMESGSGIPIIMMTGSESIENRVLCLNWGADDFLVHPISLLELEARIRAVVRRARSQHSPHILSWAGLTLDPRTHTATCDGTPLHLRPTSFTLLARLMRSAPNVVTRKELELEVYGDSPPDSDALRTHIHLLRRTLEAAGKPVLKTVSHVGFRLEN